jgi:hypothetical protein
LLSSSLLVTKFLLDNEQNTRKERKCDIHYAVSLSITDRDLVGQTARLEIVKRWKIFGTEVIGTFRSDQPSVDCISQLFGPW